MAQQDGGSPTFVLVHGAFHGGWCWSETVQHLQAAGARVYAPSLTGMADRSHLFSPSVSLATHVQDIVGLIEYEQLDGCILAGHSYGGNVISGVADQLRERVSHYIFVDATVPPAGLSQWAWHGKGPVDENDKRYKALMGPGRGEKIAPFPATAFGLSDPKDIARVESRLTPMPRDCYMLPIPLKNGATEGLRRSYIAAADPAYERMKPFVKRASTEAGWTFRSIQAGHDMMVSHPAELAAVLLELAGDSSHLA